jgi:hypothetical protein
MSAAPSQEIAIDDEEADGIVWSVTRFECKTFTRTVREARRREHESHDHEPRGRDRERRDRDGRERD